MQGKRQVRPIAADACLFDLDGTLIEQRNDFALMRRRVVEILQGYRVPEDHLQGLDIFEMIAAGYAYLGQRASEPAEKARSEALRAVEEIELAAAEGAILIAGASDLLRVLISARIGIGIVTRNSRAAVARVLERLTLPFDVLLTRDDVPHVKPDPRHLEDALAALGVPAYRALMCGDHPMDIVAGQAAGMYTVGVLSDDGDPKRFERVSPDLLLDKVGDLATHLALAERTARDDEGR